MCVEMNQIKCVTTCGEEYKEVRMQEASRAS